MILVWRKDNIEKNCLCVTVLCTVIMMHKGTSSSDRFGMTLILLGLALCLPSASVSSVFMVLYIKFCLHTSLSLPLSELSLVGLALGP